MRCGAALGSAVGARCPRLGSAPLGASPGFRVSHGWQGGTREVRLSVLKDKPPPKKKKQQKEKKEKKKKKAKKKALEPCLNSVGSKHL